MDRSWMYASRASKEYLEGVEQFLNFAFMKASSDGKISCPCVKCVNAYWWDRKEVYVHLICHGFLAGYTRWFCHGELESTTSLPNESHVRQDPQLYHDMHGLLNDLFGGHREEQTVNGDGSSGQQPRCEIDVEAQTFYNFVKDADLELYPGCKTFSKLSFIVHLFHLKCLNGWSGKSFTMLLELLKQAFPLDETFPKSSYHTKKYLGKLGLGYEKIDACPNDCMLYWKEKVNEEACLTCGASRWQRNENDKGEDTSMSSKKKKKAAKVLRYFPLKQRLQRLFMSSELASFMRWHDEGRNKDGALRHPADSLAWKDFDSRYPEFSSDPRNVRLGLASDGFNPFRSLSSTYSSWPVILMPYNLPPWMCTKQSSLILSLLIPGPKGPGNDIDVYLQPLIDELIELWEVGIDTYDADREVTFRMYAALMWTISDFPAYAYLSGWSTSGKLACPSCNFDTCSRWLKHSKKNCYLGHRRFLEPSHRFRHDRRSFDGSPEFRVAPILPSGSTVLGWLQGMKFTYGKKKCKLTSKRGRQGKSKEYANKSQPLKKRSIFFRLPYWEYNLLHHNLDVMHIEKNVCDNLLGTLLNLEWKTKDDVKSRLDLNDMGIRPELYSQQRGSKTYLPPACFTMARKEKETFCKCLESVKVPDGYASNISRCVRIDQLKIQDLKSHDNHILIQQLLPIAIRGLLPKNVTSVLIEFCNFFREICSKVLHEEDLERLNSRIALTLCHMEKIFPPSFFTIMVHLVIHLATEAKLAGPVHYRWMYPIERYLSKLKSYVHNRAHPEGSIAEGYLAEECLTFCSRYLSGVETRFTRNIRNDDFVEVASEKLSSIFCTLGKPIGAEDNIWLDRTTWLQAHRYVLFNCTAIAPFLKEHAAIIKRQNRSRRLTLQQIENIQAEKFQDWFEIYVTQLDESRNEQITDEIRWLARGPNRVAKSYSGLNINGFRFHTKERSQRLKTQNCGIMNIARTNSYASARDNRPVIEDLTYYGLLVKIIELNYYGRFKVRLFKCDWADVEHGRGKKEDEFGFTLVNFSHLIHTGNKLRDDPFVLASQVQQVFYVPDSKDKNWSVVIKVKPRDVFDMGEEVIDDMEATFMESALHNAQLLENTNEVAEDIIGWVRTDVDGTTVNTSLILGFQALEEGHINDSESNDIEADDCN